MTESEMEHVWVLGSVVTHFDGETRCFALPADREALDAWAAERRAATTDTTEFDALLRRVIEYAGHIDDAAADGAFTTIRWTRRIPAHDLLHQVKIRIAAATRKTHETYCGRTIQGGTMRIITTAAVAVALIGGTALPAHAGLVPVRPADHVDCFIHAVPPFKTGYSSLSPIGYGYQLHCTPHRPALISVTVKLWRLDFGRLETYQHSAHDYIFNPEFDRNVLYYASCSNASTRYGFHTEAIIDAVHGNYDDYSDNSPVEQLGC